MRHVDHFIAGSHAFPRTRLGDIFDPNSGEIQAQVSLGDAAVLEAAA